MNLIDRLLGRTSKSESAVSYGQNVQMVNGYNPSFRTYNGKLYESELVRASVEAFARHCSKLKPEITGNAYKELKKIILTKPNPYQTTSQFLARVATILKMDTTCFIVPIMSEDSAYITGFYPLRASNAEVMEHKGVLWFRYTFANGQKAAIEYNRVGVLINHQYLSDFFGDGNDALAPTMSLIQAQQEGMQEAIKQGAAIKFIAKIATVLRDEDLKKERDNFSDFNFSSDNKTGVLMYSSKMADVQQIKPHSYVVDKEQMDFIKNSVFNYFGTNEDILQNKFSENVWNAYYEGQIEPFAIQLSQALTNMMFTKNEIAHGNEIKFTANQLQYASNQTKLEITTQLFDRGIFSTKDVADVWNLTHEGEAKYYIRLEYAEKNRLDTPTEQDKQEIMKVELEKVQKGNEDDNEG